MRSFRGHTTAAKAAVGLKWERVARPWSAAVKSDDYYADEGGDDDGFTSIKEEKEAEEEANDDDGDSGDEDTGGEDAESDLEAGPHFITVPSGTWAS